MTQEQFIKQIASIICEIAPSYNILCPSAVIAQAILESGSGTSELAKNAHNYFGLKYRPNRCPTACGTYYKTGSEQNSDGSYTSSAMQWLKFKNMRDGVIGYFDFTNISNYKNLKGVTNPKTYLKNIKAAGYATSIFYVTKVMNIVNKYDLTKYDGHKDEVQTTKYYRVQVGVFSKIENAKTLQRQLQTAGFSTTIKNINGLYKVQIGAYSKKENANACLKKVKAKGFNAFITHN